MDKEISASIERCVAHLAREHGVTQDVIWEVMRDTSTRRHVEYILDNINLSPNGIVKAELGRGKIEIEY